MIPITPALTIETEVQTFGASAATIMRLIGPLTMRTLFDFQRSVRAVKDTAIILDLSQVPYMDSGGLGCVISAYTSCQRDQRKFAITGICNRIQSLFTVTHINGLLPCFDSMEAAVASVNTP